MKATLVQTKGSWLDVYNACRSTVDKLPSITEPLNDWKIRLLKSEHSPIRKLIYVVRLTELPYWVSVHLSRHKIGVEHFVTTQRSDRTGIARDELPQGALVTLEMELNAQAIITISRKRLCHRASEETQEAWGLVVKELDDVMQSVCVKECVYRGFCPEMESCKYTKTKAFKYELLNYRGV